MAIALKTKQKMLNELNASADEVPAFEPGLNCIGAFDRISLFAIFVQQHRASLRDDKPKTMQKELVFLHWFYLDLIELATTSDGVLCGVLMNTRMLTDSGDETNKFWKAMAKNGWDIVPMCNDGRGGIVCLLGRRLPTLADTR